MRAAFGAERLGSFGSAFGGLDENFGFARSHLEKFFIYRNTDPECRTLKRLAVCTMAQPDFIGIDFGFVRDITTQTSAVDFHRSPPFSR